MNSRFSLVLSLETICLIAAVLGLLISLRGLADALRIRRSQRCLGINGPLKILAESGVRNEVLRLSAQLVLMLISVVGCWIDPDRVAVIEFYLTSVAGRTLVSLILTTKTAMNLYDRHRLEHYFRETR